MAMLLMPRGASWVFFRVALIVALDWFMTWRPKDNVEGLSGDWAEADEYETRRQSMRTAPPKNLVVPCFESPGS